jgi:hypothetical protein
MPRAVAEILADIHAFPPPAGILRGWRPFAELVAELQAAGGMPAAIPELLRYFERHPTARLIGGCGTSPTPWSGGPGSPNGRSWSRSGGARRIWPSALRVGRPRGNSTINGVRVADVLQGAAGRGEVPDGLRETIRRVVRSCCEPSADAGAAPQRGSV